MSFIRKSRIPAYIAVAGFAALTIFQILLAAGLPLGRAAYWGVHETLPPGLRIVSAVSAMLLIAAIWTVLVRSGIIVGGKTARTTANWMIWGYTVLFALSSAANMASTSRWERLIMVPLAVVLTLCCLLVALGGNNRGDE